MNKKQSKSEFEIYLKGEKVGAKLLSLSIENLFFDELNPRISLFRDSHLGALGLTSLTQDQIMYSLQSSSSFLELKTSVVENNGAMNPLWVYGIEGKNYCVIEGNTRLAIYKELNEEQPDNPCFKKINCFILPFEIEDEVKDFIRLTAHLHGQTPWDKYEQAKYLFILWEKKRYPIKDLVKMTKLTSREIQQDIEAYQIMEEEFTKVFSPNDRGFVHRFSYFKEFVKNKKLRVTMEEQKFNETDFSKWVADGKLIEARNVRKLADIINNKSTRESFLAKDFDRAYEKLKDVIPEKSDKVYHSIAELTNQLEKMTLSEIKNIDDHKKRIIEQLKNKLEEILRIGG